MNAKLDSMKAEAAKRLGIDVQSVGVVGPNHKGGIVFAAIEKADGYDTFGNMVCVVSGKEVA